MIRIICPQCKQPLTEVEQEYECPAHGLFESVNGLPCLITGPDKQAQTFFRNHWETHRGTDCPRTKLDVAREFLVSALGAATNNLNALDIGCSDDVHAMVLDQSRTSRINYCAVDISIPALYTVAARNPCVTFIVAGAENLTFEDGAFDITFSSGVLAYTSSPRQSFEEMVRVTRPGSLIGVWFYPEPIGLQRFALRAVRSIIRVSPRFVANLISNAIVPFLPLLPTASGISLRNAIWSQCREIVLVNIAPEKLWYPTDDEVLRLFREQHIEVMTPENAPRITVWGVKG